MVVCPTERDAPQLPRFYAGREVLITGATGFMGKVLVERLLWTCPEVARLHLLLRARRGVAPDQRLADLKQSQVFANIRAQCPSRLDKLAAVAGDITAPRLGLDDAAVAALRQVSVVFHSAATIKFLEPLSDAVSLNTLSAIYVMDVCDMLPALEALVHVSTAYVNSEQSVVEERVCAAPRHLHDVLRLLRALSPEELQARTPELIYPKFNTYLFTKALAEVAVAQRIHRNYSVTIFRPTIVISAHRAPFPGWVEGLAGVVGVVVAGGRGALRVARYEPHRRADVVPVDVAVDHMIAAAWETATDKPATARVYYCGSQEHPVSWGEVRALLHEAGVRYPMAGAIYYPYIIGSGNRWVCAALETLLQTLPLHLLEYGARACGARRSTSFITIASRLSTLSAALSVFSCREWEFRCDGMRRLRDKLRATDGHLFHLDIRDVNWQETFSNFHRGARRHVLRQPDESLPQAHAHMRRLRAVHYVLKLLFALLCCLAAALVVRHLLRGAKTYIINN